jgi:hypothetical protein
LQSTVAVDAGNGIPDGLLFASGDDIRNRDLQAVIEVKATMKQKPSALKELDGYCSEKLLNSNGLQRVLGIAAVGDGASGLNVEVVSYNLAVLKGLRQPVLDTNGAKVKTFPTSEEVEQYLQVRHACTLRWRLCMRIASVCPSCAAAVGASVACMHMAWRQLAAVRCADWLALCWLGCGRPLTRHCQW